MLIARGLVLGVDLGYYEAPGRRHGMNEAGRRMRRALSFALQRTREPLSVHGLRAPR